MSKLPKLRPSLTDYVVNQTRQAARQARTSAFALSGTAVTAEGVVTVDGELDINGPLAVHGTAAFDGDTTIGGNAAITGTLSLPNGIINNDALNSPVTAQYVWFTTANFALATSYSTARVTSTISVPAGMTSAVVSVVGRLFAINPNAGADYLYAVSTIDGPGSGSIPLLVGPSGGSGINVAPFSTVLTGLTGGGTFVIALWGRTDIASWATNAANTAEVSGTILWFR